MWKMTQRPDLVSQCSRVFKYKRRVVLSKTSLSNTVATKKFHSTPIEGHMGFHCTCRRLTENVYWVGIQIAVPDFVQSYDVCQRQKYAVTTLGAYFTRFQFLMQYGRIFH